MKIIHTGDVHLGAATRNLPTEKAKLRKAEILDTFRRMTIYARENAITAVLIAGDLFDGNNAPASLKQDVFSFIQSAKPVAFFYVSGNHDGELVLDGAPENFYTFSETRSWKSYDLPDGVTVTGIDGKYADEGCYARLVLRPDRYNIVLMHGDTAYGGEKISLANLQNKHIDYLALGHIHVPTLTPERLDGRGHYRYCGCLEGRGFDECGKRGFFLLETSGGKLLDEKFLSLSKREICERYVDVSACKTYFDVERCAEETLRNEPSGNMIKLILRGRYSAELRKDISLLSERLNQRFFHVKVVDESKLAFDYRQFETDLSERGEFVREVGRYEMDEAFRAEILEVGLKALCGEEIDL
ncbi:MAG: DNA repair exonuclease [Clostridia bacterium]|nr:DNA repair exonuclease [Clostridia bacterium]